MLAYAFERRLAQDVAHNARKFAWVERRGSRDFSAARRTDLVRALWPVPVAVPHARAWMLDSRPGSHYCTPHAGSHFTAW